jgi:hypothetical protein
MRQYELTLTFDIEAEDIAEAKEIATTKAIEEGARNWTIEGKLGGLKDQGDG